MYFLLLLAGAGLACSAAIEVEKRQTGVPQYFQTTPELFAGKAESFITITPIEHSIDKPARSYTHRRACFPCTNKPSAISKDDLYPSTTLGNSGAYQRGSKRWQYLPIVSPFRKL